MSSFTFDTGVHLLAVNRSTFNIRRVTFTQVVSIRVTFAERVFHHDIFALSNSLGYVSQHCIFACHDSSNRCF